MFVPNISFGPPIVDAIRPHTTLPFDIHLMVMRPVAFIAAFSKVGAERLIVHLEAEHPGGDPLRTFEAVRASGCKVGLAINPETALARVAPYAASIDFLLIMTVHPGFGGQAFLPATVEKIESAYVLREAHQSSYRIGVDGGINLQTAPSVLQAGADVLVCGTSLFRSPNPAESIRELRLLPGREGARAAIKPPGSS
jgi:ribulose-phosphate 3-epimerase